MNTPSGLPATAIIVAMCHCLLVGSAFSQTSDKGPEPPSAPAPGDRPQSSAPQVTMPSPAQSAPPQLAAAAPQGPATIDLVNNAKLTDRPATKDGVSPSILRAQVLLDRLHDSPGVIDGRDGANYVHALQAFESERNLKITTALDEKTWSALVGEGGGQPVLASYVLTDADVAGPFFPDLPKDYGELAKLKTLGYRSVSQKIGAKFHMGENLLAALNPGLDLAKSGTRILIANIAAKPIHEKVSRIIVDKGKAQVRGYDGKGRVILAVPATIGSRELPSPSGTYKVRGIARDPIYYYDPDKNFVQGENKEKLKLPPGPNNPVGSVFIALTKPTYGLHGTPDPSTIDKTASHGCVRMTNWDAIELSSLVKRGVVVEFTN